ncbi:MAG: DUF2752 domain-containing protein [Actinomycetes bacterium]|nr:MAG: DUF2752 domain-containing protein [Actinomycetota bacterium]
MSDAAPSPQPQAGVTARARLLNLAGPLATAAVAAAGTAYIVAKNPHIPGATYVCPFYALTGMYCPGCGGTRAVYDLAHGDVLGALSMNPLFTLSVPLIAVLWVRWLLRGQGVQLREWPFHTWLAFVIPTVIVGFAVLRNIPMFAPYLAP